MPSSPLQQSVDGTTRIGVVGLGYVGWPLALAFAAQFPTRGFDIDVGRVEALRRGEDATGESEAPVDGQRLPVLVDDIAGLADCTVYIITVPTPVDEANRPDLSPLRQASRAVGALLKPGDLVVYESTVYPGTTEEVCVPELEAASGLAFNRDFTCGYSPERINPGDRTRRLADIVKVTSGSTAQAGAFVDALYRRIITAGTHLAPSMRVAEAAKVIENTQRDVNIALVNELAMIFNKMGLDSRDVLAAAATKWNFLPFTPGLVGGHCIGVDPYYLTHKATVLGYHPELILAARRINNRMGIFVAHQVLRLMARKRINVVDARVLVLGVTFKENCPDLRNTRVMDIVNELREAHAGVDVHDPLADPALARRELGVSLVAAPEVAAYDAVVLAVPHAAFVSEAGRADLRRWAKPHSVVYDTKSALEGVEVDGRL
ncbi:nucleotide sugar dehydrogenase [Lysobacter sp. A3-1-A15]|uniref:nucleotide sugar dehydrogenase n=1 Tax=Novilysobacter viscosus TaxID=3098602 RepID=UPI002ED91867